MGLFPGPGETEEAFSKRASNALSVVQGGRYPSIEKKYGFSPDWIEIEYSDKGLYPWEGGCTWIFEEEGFRKTKLQLRHTFKGSSTYLKIYDREEILTHELAHVGRITFDEPKFEEFLAYRTSPNRFRRVFSPLFEKGYEAFVFLSAIFLFIPLLNLVPITLFAAGLLRLKIRHKTFERALNSLKGLLGNDAESFLYRLSDEEITYCAHNTPEAIAQKFSSNTFRHRFLRECYAHALKRGDPC